MGSFSGPLPSVPEVFFHTLIVPVTMEELHEVLTSMKPGSAPASYGFAAACYVRAWTQLGPSILQVVNVFIETYVAHSFV